MPVKDQAAYMREYRAKQKAEATAVLDSTIDARQDFHTLVEENAALTAEVARLKRELAARPEPTPNPYSDPAALKRSMEQPHRTFDSFKAFRPAPKPGRK